MPVPIFSPQAMAALTQYDYPGNIRELQNILERACLLCCRMDGPWPQPDAIQPEHLPRELAGDVPLLPAQEGQSALAASEKAMIAKALREAEGNQTRAAKALGITRDNIRYRIRKYGIDTVEG